MKKLSKNQNNELTHFVTRLELASKEISDAVETLREKVNLYNDILSEARDFRDDVVGEMEAYVDERSETWPDTDAGEAYSAWKEEWESLELDDIEDPEGYDDLAHRDLLENVSPEPGGV